MILKEELKYSKSHEWVALDGDSAVVGTDRLRTVRTW